MMAALNAYEYTPDGTPKILLILLHGYGANGADLFGLKHYLVSRLGADIAIAAPDAPQVCEMGIGQDYRQWFSLLDRSPEALQQGAASADVYLNKFIEEQLEKHNLTADKLIIAGFSQGCMMALYSGLKLSATPAAIIGWSGMFIDGGVSQKPPIQLWHGSADEVVPPVCLNDAAYRLKEHGIDAETHTVTGAGHTIAPEMLEGSINFIKKHF